MRGFITAVPWFLPGLVAALTVALVARAPVARRLGCSPPVASLLIASVGLILAATLTPLVGAIEEGVSSSGTCNTRRLGHAAPMTYLRPSEALLNVLLFVPLGIAITWLPRSRSTTLIFAGALGLSIIVEGTQMLVPVLGRGCETADIVDNTTGLLLGMILGRVVVIVTRRQRADRRGPRPG